MCNSCINLINNHMVKLALEKSVPIIAGGYIGGQVPKDSVIMLMDLDVQARFRSESIKRYLRNFGPEAETLLRDERGAGEAEPASASSTS